MLTDRFGLNVSTSSSAARDAFVEGTDLLFELQPAARTSFTRALEEDPSFVLAHLGVAQIAAYTGDVAGLKAALGAAKQAAAGLSPRESSQLNFFSLLLSGQSAMALVAARLHLGEWPRDAAVMNHYGPILGLISQSGRPGIKREQELVMDSFAPVYGGDWWYDAHHAMALSEVGRRDEALVLAERSLAARPSFAWAAHSRAHIAYEDGEADGARCFLGGWLSRSSGENLIHGHLAWHLAIAELAAGNQDAAFSLFDDAVAPGKHLGPARTRVTDAISFLWRWELAGNPRDPALWQTVDDMAHTLLPAAGAYFGDWHIAIADAVTGNSAALEARIAQMESMSRAGRYPEGTIIQDMARGLRAFAEGDHAGTIAILSPFLGEVERVGGSRAQQDLIEFTVLRACIEAGRHDELRHCLASRRTGPGRIPVAGLAALH